MVGVLGGVWEKEFVLLCGRVWRIGIVVAYVTLGMSASIVPCIQAFPNPETMISSIAQQELLGSQGSVTVGMPIF